MKYSLLLGRALFASIFIMSAPGHFTKSMVQSAASHGVVAPEILVPLAGVIALLGGLSVLLGYRAKFGSWLLVVFLVPVTLTMHNFWAVSDPAAAKMQQMMFMKNLVMLGGALIIGYFGTGPLSLDSRAESIPVPVSGGQASKTLTGRIGLKSQE
jgi:putative oxidoreductase